MKKRPFLRALVALLLAFSVLFSFTACTEDDVDSFFADPFGYIMSLFSGEKVPEYVPKQVDGTLQVHFVDVGQGDAILILEGTHAMLIDTGDLDNKHTDKLIGYLDALSVKKLEYLVLTHPDSDHIGGAPEIIDRFDVDTCIMSNCVKDTKIYENTLDALEKNDVKVVRGKAGQDYTLGDADLRLLAPNSDKYSDANNYSVVVKLWYGERSMLFTGDAEDDSEEEMLASLYKKDLKSDVLKMGHHGSRTSSTKDFLDAVSPTYAVICCGKGNEYGHPHAETIDKLVARGITCYRTDLYGTVILTTDGTSLSFVTEKTVR